MPVLSSISVETDSHGFKRKETFRTERGLELSIQTTAGGLYEITPNGGGVPPRVCSERFTSHLKARDALEEYIKSTDRLGYAEYPSKPADKVRKSKVKEEDGASSE